MTKRFLIFLIDWVENNYQGCRNKERLLLIIWFELWSKWNENSLHSSKLRINKMLKDIVLIESKREKGHLGDSTICYLILLLLSSKPGWTFSLVYLNENLCFAQKKGNFWKLHYLNARVANCWGEKHFSSVCFFLSAGCSAVNESFFFQRKFSLFLEKLSYLIRQPQPSQRVEKWF